MDDVSTDCGVLKRDRETKSGRGSAQVAYTKRWTIVVVCSRRISPFDLTSERKN
jgi:hypothetical protein